MSDTDGRGIEPGQTRAHGEAVADEVVEEQAEGLLEPHAETLPEERIRAFDFTGFQRMRTEWSADDGITVQRYRRAVQDVMLREFADAYAVMNDLYNIVRLPEHNPATGEPVVDEHGIVQWRRTNTGGYIEDWSLLTYRQREHFLFRITTAIFTWQQKAADIWGEAMFSKASWMERFAIAFDGVEGRATVDARTQRGNIEAADDRYFAIFLSLLSRKADALCRSLELISQRLKDTLVSGS